MKPFHKLLLLIVCALLFCVLAVFLGANRLDPSAFFVGDGNLSPLARMRVMRTICSFIAGSSLALSGMLLQSVLKNPLADPFVLGISGGSGLGAVLAFLLGLHAVSCYAVPGMAAAGAMLVLLFVLAVSGFGRHGGESLLVGGVITGTVLSGILMYLISIASVQELAGMTWWMLGDLRCGDAAMLSGGGVLLVVSFAVVLFRARSLDLLAIGDDEAFYAGIDPRMESVLFTVIASLLTAYSVAMCGILSFCGLIIPHITRRVFGYRHIVAIPSACCSGGLFMVFCDVLSRSLFAERELPPGVVTAILGGTIFFLTGLRRRRS